MHLEFTHVTGFVAVFATIISLIAMFKRDNKTDGITQGALMNNLEYVKRGVDTVILEQKDAARELAKVQQGLIINQNETKKALENAERAYQHAEKAHSRINKFGGKTNE